MAEATDNADPAGIECRAPRSALLAQIEGQEAMGQSRRTRFPEPSSVRLSFTTLGCTDRHAFTRRP